jgi:hypothetical protein
MVIKRPVKNGLRMKEVLNEEEEDFDRKLSKLADQKEEEDFNRKLSKLADQKEEEDFNRKLCEISDKFDRTLELVEYLSKILEQNGRYRWQGPRYRNIGNRKKIVKVGEEKTSFKKRGMRGLRRRG